MGTGEVKFRKKIKPVTRYVVSIEHHSHLLSFTPPYRFPLFLTEGQSLVEVVGVASRTR